MADHVVSCLLLTQHTKQYAPQTTKELQKTQMQTFYSHIEWINSNGFYFKGLDFFSSEISKKLLRYAGQPTGMPAALLTTRCLIHAKQHKSILIVFPVLHCMCFCCVIGNLYHHPLFAAFSGVSSVTSSKQHMLTLWTHWWIKPSCYLKPQFILIWW